MSRSARADMLEGAAIAYELKYAVPDESVSAFLDATRPWLAAKIYDPALPIAYARTTYFDSEDHRYLASSDEPVARRLRIREYAGAPSLDAPAVMLGPCYLELKESAGGQRSKTRIAIARDRVAAIMACAGEHSAELRTLLDGKAGRVILRELFAQQLTPQLTTWYRRQSLADADERVRVTIDTRIAFCPPTRFEPEPPTTIVGYSPLCVLEVKYEGQAPAWLDEALSGIGEPRWLSKYALGMRALGQSSL